MDEVSMIWAIRLNLWLRIEELHTVQYPRYYTGYGSSVQIILLCQYLRLNLAKSSCIPIYLLAGYVVSLLRYNCLPICQNILIVFKFI